MQKITCTQAKTIDLVDYLATLGHYPQKVVGQDHWYLSPLREERTPSFKVNRRLNCWYDHGSGQGGTIIDFGILYHHCTISGFLELLPAGVTTQSSQRQQHFADVGHSGKAMAKTPVCDEERKIKILSDQPITSPALIRYLQQRCIPISIAKACCREVRFQCMTRHYYAIGFANDKGGYELRNAYFKGSSSPKSITFIDHGQQRVTVLEGFFSYMSHLVLSQQQETLPTNYLVLNSLAFFRQSRHIMERHGYIDLLLDLNAAGIKNTQEALEWGPFYKDRSNLYAGAEDLNEWLVQHGTRQRKHPGSGMDPPAPSVRR